jgi:hypothetical protein
MSAPQFRDETVDRLAKLFLEHPAWVAAARHISGRASSNVYFSHRPGEVWRLEQRDGRTELRRGRASDPDFVFRFTPASVDRLDSIADGIGELAAELFTLIIEEDERLKIGFRVVAGFGHLTMRGYVKLLLAAGPAVLTFGARHGILTLGTLRRFVAELTSRVPEAWETEGSDGD